MNTKESPVRILHLEDDDNDAELIRRALGKTGMAAEITRVVKADSYANALQRSSFDVIISDYTLPGFDGGSALVLAKQQCPETPFIFVSGTIGEEAAIDSLKRGATNYVLKDRLNRLGPAVQLALEESAERRRLRHAENAVRERAEFFQMISENITDLVAILDLEGRRLYTSPSYQNLFGKKNLRGSDSFADVHPEDRDRMQQLFKETVRTGHGQRAEFRFQLEDGTVRYIESHGGIIQDQEGKPSSVIVVSKDITKRKLAERALKDSEDRFQSVMQAANDAIVLAGGDGNIIAWNSAAQRVFGYSEEDVRGKPLKMLLAPAYRNGHTPGIGLNSAAASRFIAVAVEAQGHRKDGTEFPLELSVSTWKTGVETYYSAIFRDISERNGIRQVLNQLRRRNEVLLNAAGEGICGLDQDGTITFANPAAAKMLGYYVDELAGLKFCDVTSRLTDAPSHAEESAFSLTLGDGIERRSADQVFRRRNGTSFPVEYVVTPIREKERVTGGVVVFKDITERQQTEERLREQAALIDNATDAICVINMDACIIYWNESAERLYGWTSAEAIGKVAPELLFKNEAHRPSEAFKTLLEHRTWEGDLHQITKAGQEVVVHSRWTLMHDLQGAPKSILVVNSDITDKKALETQCLRAQRMESIGRLATGVAHDLNNVLTPILMCSQVLAPKLGAADKQMLDAIESSARRGADMVKQILSFSRGAETERGLVLLHQVIDEQVKIARQTFSPSIDIQSRVASELWPVKGNATQLYQVLMNLCVNARDAMPKGGKLLIEAENVVIDAEYGRLNPETKPGPHVIVTITDSGVGIPRGKLKRIFEPSVTSKRPGEGMGLGLSMVLNIVKNHNGHIQVKSEVGKGTTFKLLLPATTENNATGRTDQPPSNPSAARGKGEWVLVVDNEQTVREITTVTLEHFGYRVLQASDGTEAVARYAKYQDRISLVIADLVMPFMGGAATIRALRRMNPNLKVLAVSGRVAGKTSLGPEIPFLEKPFSSEKLLSRVHELLTGKTGALSEQHANC
jgi:PAS domain S-box-containing protein